MAPAVSKNRGYSLIELMVASTISLIALGFVSSVFLSGYKLNSQRSLELMVAQDLNDTLKMMKEDIVRAGYNEGMGSSFVITGTDPSMVVHLSPPPPAIASCISYGYFDGTKKYYRSYYKSNNRLNVLTSETSTIDVNGLCKNGKSIFDYKKINVNAFDIKTKMINKGGITSQLITLDIDVSNVGSQISNKKSVTIQTRNWG